MDSSKRSQLTRPPKRISRFDFIGKHMLLIGKWIRNKYKQYSELEDTLIETNIYKNKDKERYVILRIYRKVNLDHRSCLVPYLT